MGMQCHFSESEITANPDRLEIEKVYHADSDTWSAVVSDKTLQEAYIIVSYQPGVSEQHTNGSCWFDIGQATVVQLGKLAWLIHRRICFSCS